MTPDQLSGWVEKIENDLRHFKKHLAEMDLPKPRPVGLGELREAGATILHDMEPQHDKNHEAITVYIYSKPDGGRGYDVTINGLTLPYAVAALKASRQVALCEVCTNCDIAKMRDQLAAKDAELARLQGEIAEARRIIEWSFGQSTPSVSLGKVATEWFARNHVQP